MRAFLVALSGVFADIAVFWDGIATQIAGLGTLGDFLAVGYYGLSITFSNLAQLALDGAVAAGEWETRIDALQDTLAETLLESALGEAITSIWPDFPALIADPALWLVDALAGLFPFLTTFLYFPEEWLRDTLESILPISITPGGFELLIVDGVTFQANATTGLGHGFAFTIPEGEWEAVTGQFYAMDDAPGRAELTVYRGATPMEDLERFAEIDQGFRFGRPLATEWTGLVSGVTWRVLTRSPGSLAFENRIVVQSVARPRFAEWAPVEVIGGTGPSTWTLDWSGFIDWLEGAFLSVAEGLYTLLERILRYFWEGVY